MINERITRMFRIEDLTRELRKAQATAKRYRNWLKRIEPEGDYDYMSHPEVCRVWRLSTEWNNRVDEIEHRIAEIQNRTFYDVRVVEDGYTIFLCEHTRHIPYGDITACVLKRKGKSDRNFIEAYKCSVYIFLSNSDLPCITKLEVNYKWQEEKVREAILSIQK